MNLRLLDRYRLNTENDKPARLYCSQFEAVDLATFNKARGFTVRLLDDEIFYVCPSKVPKAC